MLKGAIFKIVDMDGNEVRTNLVTNKNGKIYVPDLRLETISSLKQRLLSTMY